MRLKKVDYIQEMYSVEAAAAAFRSGGYIVVISAVNISVINAQRYILGNVQTIAENWWDIKEGVKCGLKD